MCVQNQGEFLKVEILNGFKWSIGRRVNFNCPLQIMLTTVTGGGCIFDEIVYEMVYFVAWHLTFLFDYVNFLI